MSNPTLSPTQTYRTPLQQRHCHPCSRPPMCFAVLFCYILYIDSIIDLIVKTHRIVLSVPCLRLLCSEPVLVNHDRAAAYSSTELRGKRKEGRCFLTCAPITHGFSAIAHRSAPSWPCAIECSQLMISHTCAVRHTAHRFLSGACVGKMLVKTAHDI
jgi:hypothetical protein